MSLRSKIFSWWIHKRPKALSATKIIALTFAAIIAVGTGLLMLPVLALRL